MHFYLNGCFVWFGSVHICLWGGVPSGSRAVEISPGLLAFVSSAHPFQLGSFSQSIMHDLHAARKPKVYVPILANQSMSFGNQFVCQP